MNIELPEVIDCDAEICLYNRENECHAGAINVGGPDPLCDTYIDAQTKGGFEEKITAKVGACKVTGCKFNTNYECSADGIHVKSDDYLAICDSFIPR